MEVYFDNAAGAAATGGVIEAITKMCVECYGNPTAAHSLGIKAEIAVTEAKTTIAEFLDVSPDEIIFTSGGTESNNTAVFGIAESFKRSGKHIITTKTEHPSVTVPVKQLEQKGYEVTYLDVCERGYVSGKALSEAVRPNTILTSIQHVNNETGTIQNIAELAKIVKSKNPDAVVHCDGVQAFGKIPISLKNIDLYSMSGHKIHSIKGIGCLYIKKGLKISPLIYGGGQQKGMRAGTENSMGAIAFSKAVQEAFGTLGKSYDDVLEIKNRIKKIADGERIIINGDAENGSPFILNMSFLGQKGEVLLRRLDEKGVYVSTGSACNERKKSESVLTHYGYSKDRISSAIRFSFSRFNTIDEADYLISVLNDIL